MLAAFILDEGGQSAIEYVLMLTLGAAVAALILATGVGADVAAVLAALSEILDSLAGKPRSGGSLCCYNPFWPTHP